MNGYNQHPYALERDREEHPMPQLPAIDGIPFEAGDRILHLRTGEYATVTSVQAADPANPDDTPAVYAVADGTSFSEFSCELHEVELVAKAEDGAEPPAVGYHEMWRA